MKNEAENPRRRPDPGRLLRLLVAVAAFVFALTQAARCETITVKQDGTGDFTAIEDAVEAAAEGDEVLVWPGTYYPRSRLYLDHRGISLISTDGPEATVLDAVGIGGTIMFWGGGSTPSAVIGFTFTRASSAVYCTGVTVAFENCIFTGNGIGIEMRYGCDVAISDCLFTGNNRGLDVFLECSVVVEDCIFSNNALEGAKTTTDTLHVTNCEFAGNGDAGLHAGAHKVLVENCTFHDNGERGLRVLSSLALVVDCTFSGNTGGMKCSRSSPTITGCIFDGNKGAETGGGLLCVEGSSPVITSCVFTGNSALLGGGVYSNDSTPTFDACTFVENEAEAWGGAVCADESDSLHFAYCVFAGNGSHRGGGILCYRSFPTLERCTIVGNSADDAGGITSLVGGHPYVTQSIIAFNSGPPVFCQGDEATLDRCIVYGNTGGDELCDWPRDVLNVDPLFCDYYAWDLTVCDNSPCRPGNNVWEVLVGAYGVGCGECETPVEVTTWGAIKAMYK